MLTQPWMSKACRNTLLKTRLWFFIVQMQAATGQRGQAQWPFLGVMRTLFILLTDGPLGSQTIIRAIDLRTNDGTIPDNGSAWGLNWGPELFKQAW